MMATSSPLIQPTKSHAIANDLRALLGSTKVKDDVSTITAYAVDASIYRIPPQAVVLVDNAVFPPNRHGRFPLGAKLQGGDPHFIARL